MSNGLQITRERIVHYIKTWGDRGYLGEIPDEVPDELMRQNLAPSYKAICLALLSSDMQMTSLGYSAPASEWYSAIKRAEISRRTS